MNNLHIYKKLYKKISDLVDTADPVSLGGAADEYASIVNQIIKFKNQNVKVTGPFLMKLFQKHFESETISATNEDFIELAENITVL